VSARARRNAARPSSVARIQVLGDAAATTPPDQGFLRLKRYTLVNVDARGARSAPYPCDMVSRRHADAVAVVVWGRDARRRVRVVLRENLRPPVWLRRGKTYVQPDARDFGLIPEIVAGLIETGDVGARGLARRAAAEVAEEVGWRVRPSAVKPLGGPLFASPGITDEKIFFRHVEVDLSARGAPTGDGSVMEQAGRVLILPLDTALRRCDSGAIPDMKTVVGLTRLRTRLAAAPAPRARAPRA
jgi:ADP-ribose pyrophosphatase